MAASSQADSVMAMTRVAAVVLQLCLLRLLLHIHHLQNHNNFLRLNLHNTPES
jgi:hypothetical protein